MPELESSSLDSVSLAQSFGIPESLLSRVPVPIEAIARNLGVASISRVPLPIDGALFPRGDTYSMLIDRDAWWTRQRFTCAHEIAHRLLQPQLVASRQVSPAMSTHAEKVCDRLAAALLMPRPQFEQDVQILGPSMRTLIRLAHSYRTSIRATAIRFVEAMEAPCLLIASKYQNGKSGHKLRVAWSRQNMLGANGKPVYFVPREVSLSLNSALSAHCSDSVVTTNEVFKAGRVHLAAQTQSKGFGYGENRFVLSLLFPNSIAAEKQGVSR